MDEPIRFENNYSKPSWNLKILLSTLAICISIILVIGGLLFWKAVRADKSDPLAETIQFGSGFFDWEFGNGESWRWMQDEGNLRLRNLGKDAVLRFDGHAPAAKAPEPPKIRLFLNGALLAEFDGVAPRTVKTFNIPAASLGTQEWVDLQITTNYIVIPAQKNRNSQDQRRLGYQFFSFEWFSALP